MPRRACHRVPLSTSFTLSTSSFSTGVHLWIGSMGRKKRGKSGKGATATSLLFLVMVLTEFYSRLLHQDWKPLGLWQWQDKIRKYGKAQLQLPGPDASKAYQHGQYRLVHGTSTGVLSFYTLAGVVCPHPFVGPISFVWRLFCFLQRTTKSKPSSSTVSAVCSQKQTVIVTKYWHGAEREKA